MPTSSGPAIAGSRYQLVVPTSCGESDSPGTSLAGPTRGSPKPRKDIFWPFSVGERMETLLEAEGATLYARLGVCHCKRQEEEKP